MKLDAYLIKCVTNMHAGSGNANYGVIDNLVQRDIVTKLPTVHASSLKGALREFFKNEWGEGDLKLEYVFGPDPKRGAIKGGIGYYNFFDADLLCIPIRSNKKPFFRATAKMAIDTILGKSQNLSVAINDKTLCDKLQAIDFKEPQVNIFENINNVVLEDWKAVYSDSLKDNLPSEQSIIGQDVALFDNDTFKKFVKKLPVIARNQLDNGKSKNLWYEEVVPRESRFVSFVGKNDKYQQEFDEAFNNKIVQIGGNASVGYGYCSIQKIS